METGDMLEIAENMAIELIEKTEGPADAMLITYQIQDILRAVSIKNLEMIKAAERIKAKTGERHATLEEGKKL